MLNHFAFVVEGEVFHRTSLNDESPNFEKWIAAFSSNPLILNVNQFPDINKTYLYKNGNFFAPEDVDMVNPVSQGESVPEGVNRFAVICENDVVGIMTYIKDDMNEAEFYKMEAGLNSGALVLPCEEPVEEGWLWNGESFSPAV